MNHTKQKILIGVISDQAKGNDYSANALVRTGSDRTIISNDLIGVRTDRLKEVMADIGWERITVYEAEIDSFAIEDLELEHVKKRYVSDLDYFREQAVIGADVLDGLNIKQKMQGNMEISFLGDE